MPLLRKLLALLQDSLRFSIIPESSVEELNISLWSPTSALTTGNENSIGTFHCLSPNYPGLHTISQYNIAATSIFFLQPPIRFQSLSVKSLQTAPQVPSTFCLRSHRHAISTCFILSVWKKKRSFIINLPLQRKLLKLRGSKQLFYLRHNFFLNIQKGLFEWLTCDLNAISVKYLLIQMAMLDSQSFHH